MDDGVRGGAAATPSTAEPLEALPVLLELARPDAGRVVAWVEGVLGWQPVDGDAGGLPARLRLADVPAVADVAGDRPADIPTVLLVGADDPPVTVATATRRLRPAAVVGWPDARDTLVATAAGLLARTRPPATDELVLRVGGAAGGVGTTTVALAVGALAAWRLGTTLVLAAGIVPMATPRLVELDTLAAPRTFDEARPVPGVPGLRVVRTTAPPVGVPVDPGPAAVVVRDVGRSDDADVLVLRRDAAGVAGLERSAAGIAVVLDDGLAPIPAVVAAAARRPVVMVPRSSRVARAGLLGHVPTALPASYLRALRPLVTPEVRRGR
ncbi:MAG: hypothetical protein KY461_03330 [Actinobacteria bacterium]|nr:hypothetical protein [Actinomycetota bacterium]